MKKETKEKKGTFEHLKEVCWFCHQPRWSVNMRNYKSWRVCLKCYPVAKEFVEK